MISGANGFVNGFKTFALSLRARGSSFYHSFRISKVSQFQTEFRLIEPNN